MNLLMGIDIGTSSAKVMLLDAEKGVLGVEKREYEVSVPQSGYAEQEPELWWRAVQDCIGRLRQRYGSLFSYIGGCLGRCTDWL